MGGGGTMLAANSTPSLKASMAMCPWNPGTSYSMMTVPSLQFGGTNDGLAGAPMPDNQYTSIPMTTFRIVQPPSLMPASRTILPHLAVSLATKARNSSGVFARDSTLSCLSRAAMSG